MSYGAVTGSKIASPRSESRKRAIWRAVGNRLVLGKIGEAVETPILVSVVSRPTLRMRVAGEALRKLGRAYWWILEIRQRAANFRDGFAAVRKSNA